MKKSAVVALVIAAVVTAAVLPVATVAVATRPSEYTYQEVVTTSFVKSLGSFAVTVYKLAHGLTMYYQSTSECWSVAASGPAGYRCYWMLLTAKDGNGTYGGKVSTVCGVPGSQTWKLISFNSTN
ncbi:unnamed protein product [Alopecurus aequalis]